MNIVILAGGTGSKALQTGLKRLYPTCKITTLINAYDDGKSTGVCRKVCNVLGPSDVRKNQYTQYQTSHKPGDQEYWITCLFNARYDIPEFNPEEFCINKLDEFNVPHEYRILFDGFIMEFFSYMRDKDLQTSENLKDFSIANILYAVMFNILGYEDTINFFSKTLGLTDHVVLNSHDNGQLIATTDTGSCITTEAEIVEFAKWKDSSHFESQRPKYITNVAVHGGCRVNPEALSCIKSADIIVLSSGTQWASLIPTYMTQHIGEAISESEATKIMVMNNKQDDDMPGISGSQIVEFVSVYLDTREFTVLCNTSGDEFLHVYEDELSLGVKEVVFDKLGDSHGKHLATHLGSAIFEIHFKLKEAIDLISDGAILISDLDGTLCDPYHESSLDNMRRFNALSENTSCAILSGNCYEHLQEVFEDISILEDLDNFEVAPSFGMYTNYGNVYFDMTHNQWMVSDRAAVIPSMVLSDVQSEALEFSKKGGYFNGPNVKYLNNSPVSINFCDMDDKTRTALRDFMLKHYSMKSYIAGKTSMDMIIYDKCMNVNRIKNDFAVTDSVYIGDEIDSGNEVGISGVCEATIKVSNPDDMNCVLKILEDNL